MICYSSFFEQAIKKIKKEGRYRVFNTLDYSNCNFPVAFHSDLNKEIVVWCTNNYLGMSQHPKVVEAFIESANRVGVGSGGTRNISGTHNAIVTLENRMAELYNRDAGLVFSSGYVANQASIAAIASILPECIIFSDRNNHASIIHGIKESKAEKMIFEHNDIVHLENLLSKYPTTKPKLIVFESIYSMDGDRAPIRQITELAKKYNAMTYLDEVHAVGLYGENGSGVAEELGLTNQIDVIEGNFAKGYGVVGGFIVSDKIIVDAIRSTADSFIFTTSLPPAVAAAAKTSVDYLANSNHERRMHQRNVRLVKHGLDAIGIPYLTNDTHIIPITLFDPFLCQLFADRLLHEFGIYAQAINYPTVPRGSERLRITPTPLHTTEMIDNFLEACNTIAKDLGVIQKRKYGTE